MILSPEQIKDFLPQRERFLLISGAEALGSLESEESLYDENVIHAWWDIPEDSWAVEGHFPGNPIVPGVLITEAMAQACGLLARCFEPQTRGHPVLLVAVERARFLLPVTVPARIELWPRLRRIRGSLWKFSVRAAVAGNDVATCEIMAQLLTAVPPVAGTRLREISR